MDIHAPDKPVHTFKDFAVHIAIVTIGIFIALGLEGVREMYYEHKLVRETRENFRNEMTDAREKMAQEIQRVETGHEALTALAKEASTLAADHPEQVLARLEAVHYPHYFFSTNSWQTALSSGALAHMHSDEVSLYAWSAESTRNYIAQQDRTSDAETQALVFWQSHAHPTAEQITDGVERILLYNRDLETLSFVGPQTQGSFQHVLDRASH